MELDRLNPVTLITGAASGVGAGWLRDLARRSQGGLILVDADEAALSAVADDLEAQNAAPERVSMLAFDVADEARWAQAATFIESQYGRLDWALVNACAPPSSLISDHDVADWRKVMSTEIESVFLTLHSLMPLMRKNLQGGAVVVSAMAAAQRPNLSATSRAELLQAMRVAAKEGAHSNIRINAIAPGGGADAPKAPWFNDLVRESGSARAAFDRISHMPTPMARYAGADDVGRLVVMLLCDDSPMTGAALIVDGG